MTAVVLFMELANGGRLVFLPLWPVLSGMGSTGRGKGDDILESLALIYAPAIARMGVIVRC